MCLKACYVSFTVLIINFNFMISARDVSSLSAEKEQNILPLLGYIHGYKISPNFALNLPSLLLSPIVIVPIMNEQQEIHIRKSTPEENDQEDREIIDKIQDINPTEIMNSEISDNVDENLELSSKIDDFTEIYNINDNSSSEDDIFKQVSSSELNVNGSQEVLEINGNAETTPFGEEESKLDNIEITNTTTKPSGPYPNAIYNNSVVNNLSITVPSIHTNLSVPIAESKWKNFSLPSLNDTINITNESHFNQSNSSVNNVLYFPTTSPIIDNENIYPPRRYYQNIDSLSITTNSYTNVEHHLPAAYDDRWQRFSSLEKSYLTSGFRPLAGLYFDGFLHKSLNKQTGFQPNQNYNYYNNYI